jgi:hypothetical protein
MALMEYQVNNMKETVKLLKKGAKAVGKFVDDSMDTSKYDNRPKTKAPQTFYVKNKKGEYKKVYFYVG